MALVKSNEYRSLSVVEIVQKRQSIEKSLGELNQKKVTGQLEKPHQYKLYRRQVAQLKTIEKEKIDDSKRSNKK